MADKKYLREEGEFETRVSVVDARLSKKGDPMLVVTLRREDGAEINAYFVPKYELMRNAMIAFARACKPSAPEMTIVRALNDALGLSDPVHGLKTKFSGLMGCAVKIGVRPQKDNPKYSEVYNYMPSEAEDEIGF